MLRNYNQALRVAFLLLLVMSFTVPIKATDKETNTDEEKDLGEIVVTTTKTEKQISEVPLLVEVITAEDLKESNAKTIMEALDLINGVDAIQDSGSWGNNSVRLRGMESSQTLILVNGQRFYGGHGGSADISTISTEMVEQIEIVKGPFSALYGSDAMGGVINIITKKTPENNYTNLSLESGSNNTRNTNLSAGFNSNEVAGNFIYTQKSSDGMEEDEDYNKDILNANLVFNFTPQSKLELSPYYSKQEQEVTGRYQERHGLNMKWNFKSNDLSNFYVRSSLFSYKHWTESQSSDYKDNSTELEVGYNKLLGTKHLFTIGSEYHSEERNDDGKNFEHGQIVRSIFIQDEMDFAPLQVILGTRVDKHELWGTEVCPNLGASYQVNEKMKLRGSIGKAFKAPTLLNLYGGDWMMGSYILVHSNPDLEPEESVGYQLGMDYNFSKNATLSTTLFRNDVDDLINSYYTTTSYPYNMYYENIDGAIIKGAEINYRLRLAKNLSGSLGYTYLDTENEETGKELTYRSKNSLSLKLNWKAPYNLDIQLSNIYKGKSYSDDENEDEVDDYSLLNLDFRKKINDNYEVYFSIDNLLDVDNDDVDNEYEMDGTEYYLGMEVKL